MGKDNQKTSSSHHTVTTEESEDFRAAIQGVKPLKVSLKISHTIHKKKSPPDSTLRLRRKQAVSKNCDHDALSDHEIEPVSPETYISYKNPAVSPAMFKSLKTGKLAISYNLDLHGYTVEQAGKILLQFIHFCQKQHYQCVRVIHGKSHKGYYQQSVTLKSFVARWLTQIPAVLAYCSCLPRDGARGAVYVLLQCLR